MPTRPIRDRLAGLRRALKSYEEPCRKLPSHLAVLTDSGANQLILSASWILSKQGMRMVMIPSAPPTDSRAGAYRLSGHETFVCRYAWLPKVVREISERNNHGLFGDTSQAMVRLGVGKNMVKSIRYWAESAQVAAEQAYDIEAIAATAGLLHDLGNPPFGHAGEMAIQDWFKQCEPI